MSIETVTDASVEHRRALVSGFVAGVLLVTTLSVLACASTGSQSAGGATNTASKPAESAAQAPPAAPPAAAAPTPAPAAPTPAPAAAAAVDSPVPGYLADPAAMQRASQLFRAVCTGYCHSTQPTAERVAPNLFDCEWAHGSSDQEIFHTLSTGVPDTQMQAFGEKLPNEDLWKLVAYIRQKSTCKS